MIPGLSYNTLLNDNQLIPELTEKFLNESKEYLKDT